MRTQQAHHPVDVGLNGELNYFLAYRVLGMRFGGKLAMLALR
jgi:hypothetical protein